MRIIHLVPGRGRIKRMVRLDEAHHQQLAAVWAPTLHALQRPVGDPRRGVLFFGQVGRHRPAGLPVLGRRLLTKLAALIHNVHGVEQVALVQVAVIVVIPPPVAVLFAQFQAVEAHV